MARNRGRLCECGHREVHHSPPGPWWPTHAVNIPSREREKCFATRPTICGCQQFREKEKEEPR